LASIGYDRDFHIVRHSDYPVLKKADGKDRLPHQKM
jgi:hypothetical protein